MTISTNCAYNNQTHCNIKNLYFNKHKHKHMVNHICWNPSFFPLPNADIHEISNFYQKRHLFIKNYSFFIKNLIDPPYKKLQPQISPFIKNSIFGNNRDPWGGVFSKHCHQLGSFVTWQAEGFKASDPHCPFQEGESLRQVSLTRLQS